MATPQEYKDYIKKNSSSLDLLKLKNLDKKGQQDAYNAWSTSGNLDTFKKATPLKINNTAAGQRLTAQRQDLANKTADSMNVMNPITQTQANTLAKTDAPMLTDLRQSDNARLGPTATANVLDDKLRQTGLAYEANQQRVAQDIEKVNQEGANTKNELITKTNEAKRDRYAAQQDTLDQNKALAESRIAQSKADADSMLKRQEGIAARQANIAAARAGETGLLMSENAIQEIKDDMLGKYATNLATAEDFRNKTNMTLNDTLTRIAGDTFKDKQAVDNFINGLDDSEIQPLLAAADAAVAGKAGAVNAIKDYHTAILQKKADEEYNRVSKVERVADNERQWKQSDPATRLALLQAEFTSNGVQSPVMDDFISNPDKYKNMTYAEAVNVMAKLDANKKLIDSAVQAAMQTGSYDKLPDSWKAVAETSGKEAAATQKQINKTTEQKQDKIKPSEGMVNTKGGMDSRTDATGANAKWGFTGKNKVELDKLLASGKTDAVVNKVLKLQKEGRLNYDTYNTIVKYLKGKGIKI